MGRNSFRAGGKYRELETVLPSIFIHPGAPKTASTFLQNEIFDKHPEVHNVGRPNHGTADHSALLHALTFLEDAQSAQETVQGFFEAAASDARKNARNTIVYSNESLSDAQLSSVVASRIHAAVPEAQIILTVRNQFNLIQSLYTGDRAILKNVPAPYAGRPVKFDAWFDHALSSIETPDAKIADFNRTYRSYAEAFGSKQVHVLLYEQFARDRSAYMQMLGSLLDIEPSPWLNAQTAPRANPTPSARLRTYQSLRSWLLPGRSLTNLLPGAQSIRRKFDAYLSRGGTLQVELNPAQKVRITELYAPGNRDLAESCGLDLAAEGYPY